jgi:hypothetical protein
MSINLLRRMSLLLARSRRQMQPPRRPLPGGFVLQNSLCARVQKFCGLEARLSGKDVRDLIASP